MKLIGNLLALCLIISLASAPLSAQRDTRADDSEANKREVLTTLQGLSQTAASFKSDQVKSQKLEPELDAIMETISSEDVFTREQADAVFAYTRVIQESFLEIKQLEEDRSVAARTGNTGENNLENDMRYTDRNDGQDDNDTRVRNDGGNDETINADSKPTVEKIDKALVMKAHEAKDAAEKMQRVIEQL